MTAALKGNQEDEHLYFACIKTGLMANLQGYAPAVSVGFARQVREDADADTRCKRYRRYTTIPGGLSNW